MDPATIRAIADGGFIVALLVALVGGYRGWWIFGPIHRAIVADLVEQRNFWRQQALRGAAITEKAVDVAMGEGKADAG